MGIFERFFKKNEDLKVEESTETAEERLLRRTEANEAARKRTGGSNFLGARKELPTTVEEESAPDWSEEEYLVKKEEVDQNEGLLETKRSNLGVGLGADREAMQRDAQEIQLLEQIVLKLKGPVDSYEKHHGISN